MNKEKLVKLYYLNAGDKFEYPDLKNLRNLEVVRASEAGMGIKGEMSNDNGETWTPLSKNYTVSTQSLVRIK